VQIPDGRDAKAQEHRQGLVGHVHVRVDQPRDEGSAGSIHLASGLRSPAYVSFGNRRDPAASHDDGGLRRDASIAVHDADAADEEIGGRRLASRPRGGLIWTGHDRARRDESRNGSHHDQALHRQRCTV
jgi:hypothetical protein